MEEMVKSVHKFEHEWVSIYVHLNYKDKSVSISKSENNPNSDYVWYNSKNIKWIVVANLIASWLERWFKELWVVSDGQSI